jgi:hypothetical protein
MIIIRSLLLYLWGNKNWTAVCKGTRASVDILEKKNYLAPAGNLNIPQLFNP